MIRPIFTLLLALCLSLPAYALNLNQAMSALGAAKAGAAGAKPAEKGANLVIVERSGASDLFRRSMPDHPAPLASPFIVYLDLLKDARGRNQELASQLRSTVLKV